MSSAKLEYLSVWWQCVFDKLHCQPPGLCSAQGAWFSGKPCSINICSKAGRTTPRHSGLILVFRTVGDRCKMTILRAVSTAPSVWKKCQNRNLSLLFTKFDPLWSQIDPFWSQINPPLSQSQPELSRLQD